MRSVDGYLFRIPYINVGFTREVSFAMKTAVINARIATQARLVDLRRA